MTFDGYLFCFCMVFIILLTLGKIKMDGGEGKYTTLSFL